MNYFYRIQPDLKQNLILVNWRYVFAIYPPIRFLYMVVSFPLDVQTCQNLPQAENPNPLPTQNNKTHNSQPSILFARNRGRFANKIIAWSGMIQDEHQENHKMHRFQGQVYR